MGRYTHHHQFKNNRNIQTLKLRIEVLLKKIHGDRPMQYKDFEYNLLYEIFGYINKIIIFLYEL